MRFLNGYCEDCTMTVRFRYNLCNVSVRRGMKSRVVVKNVNTYDVAKSHLRVLKNRTENHRQINHRMPMANITEGQVSSLKNGG